MNILTATVRVTGLSPYSPSAPLPDEFTKRGKNETANALEARVWRHRIWTNPEGHVYQPASCYKKAVDSAAGLTKRKIVGQGNQTFAQQIISGVMILDDVPIFLPQTDAEIKAVKPVVPILTSEVVGRQIYCSATGDRRGIGTRVFRTYGMIPKWQAVLIIRVVNATITTDIMENYLEEAGLLIGIGRWRPANGGSNGRFLVNSCTWSEGSLQ